MSALRRLGHRLRTDQRGISIIEVVVASMLLVLGAVAIFKIVDAATRTSYRAEQAQVASNLLQRELEKMKAVPASELWVTEDTAAACGSSPIPDELDAEAPAGSPGKVSGPGADASPDATGFAPCEQVSPDDGEGSSDVGATVYRAVYWFDPDKASCESPLTGSDEDQFCGMKRIMLMVVPDATASGGERTAREIQADVINPPDQEDR